MREILFRGKPKSKAVYQLFSQTYKDNCKDGFMYGSLVVSKGKYYICVSVLCKLNRLINNGITTMLEVIPETIGQFTGVTDKNGEKIFEGDILQTDKNNIGRVTWYEEHCGFMIFSIVENKVYWLYDNDFSRIEIIGNIHDNPELLKGGAE